MTNRDQAKIQWGVAQRQAFPDHVHAMACAMVAGKHGLVGNPDEVAKAAIKQVRAVQAALANEPEAQG